MNKIQQVAEIKALAYAIDVLTPEQRADEYGETLLYMLLDAVKGLSEE